jgi:hypothetical protein
MRRRHLLAMLVAATTTPDLAFAASAPMLPMDKAFPFLAAYLGLPATERTRFYLVIRAYRDKRPIADAKATLVAANGVRTPIVFDRQGIVTRPPDLATLKSGAHVEVDSTPFQFGPELRCVAQPSTRIDVGELTLALAQVNKAIAKLAGALSLIAPKLTVAYFPDAGAAQALMADGRTATLPAFTFPAVGAVSYIEPSALIGARTVVLARAPSRILLGGHPRA